MAGILEIPARNEAQVRSIELEVTTKVGGEEKSSTFAAELPRDLASAVSLLGEKEVFHRFINAYVVFLQGKERNRLQKTEDKPRKRAPYLEQLGI